MTKIKFCGLKREEDIRIANQLKPDYVGFVFWEKSKRNVSPETAGRLRNILNEDISTVGVFVDADPSFPSKLANEGIINLIQLHGTEDEGYIEKLRMMTRVPIIKAFEIKNRQDILKASESTADYILLDAGKGEGKAFSWDLISDVKREYFLAGGLDPLNAAQAVERLHPYALDVSSGIESDGYKDAYKMKSFMEEVKAADSTDTHSGQEY